MGLSIRTGMDFELLLALNKFLNLLNLFTTTMDEIRDLVLGLLWEY